MKKMQKIVPSLILCVAIVAMSIFTATPSTKAAADVTISFNPVSTSVIEGDSFAIDIMVNPGTHQVSNADLALTFDSNLLDLTSVTNTGSPFSVIQASTIGTGTLVYSAGTAMGSNVTTASLYATLNFTALATGSSVVAIGASTAFYADDEPGVNELASTNVNTTVAVSPEGSDVTPPVITNTTTSSLVAGTTQKIVSVTTNENATCKYNAVNVIGVVYASMANTFAGAGATSHTFTATGLTDGGNYAYAVRCQDTASTPNANMVDTLVSFSVASPVVITPSTSNNDGGGSNHKSSGHSKKKKKTPPRKISNSKKIIARGATLTQRGKKFSKNALVQLYFSKPGGGYYAPQTIKTSSTGAFLLKYRVTKPKGQYGWYAVDTKTGKKSKIVYYKVK